MKKKNEKRPSIFFFPYPYPLALAVNKSPAIHIFHTCAQTPHPHPPPLSKKQRSSSFSDFYWGEGWGLYTGYIFYLWRENRGSVNRLKIIVEKNGKLNHYWAATFIKRSRPSFCRSKKSFSFVVNSIKRPSSTWRTKLRQSEIEGDDRLWTSNAALVACSF